MKKRLMSVLLCLCMTAMLLPAVQISAEAADTVSYVDEDGNLQSIPIASVTQVTSDTTEWSDGWYYVYGSVSLSGVTASGDVHLILADGADLEVTRDDYYAAIDVEGSNSLTICGQAGGTGTLRATSSDGAGIGGGGIGNGGTIIINGGAVTATSSGGAGIGGGIGAGDGGSITINGGTVTATGSGGAGIGGGDGSGNGGTITINGGTVTATSSDSGAGIGGGGGGNGGTITINGGTVTATGSDGAGIGGGYGGGGGGSIIINGGTVEAASVSSAGIGGGGGGGKAGTVYISGGSVKASGGEYAQDIGNGDTLYGSFTPQNNSIDKYPVYLTTVTLSGIIAKTAVTSLTTSLTDYTYGTKDMETDDTGKLYLYMPSGTNVMAANTVSSQHEGSVTSGSVGALPMSLGLTGLTLSGDSVQENVLVDTTVGTLDTETYGTASADFTYQLVSGEGDADNGSFSISGSSLKLAVSPDYETKNSYSIRIRSTNGDNLYFEQSFTITIENVNDVAPVVSSSDVGTTAAAGDTVAVDNALNVSDIDSATLSSAAVSITSNFQSGQDSLSFANTDSSTYGNITGSYNASTGILTLNSSDAAATTMAQWQKALRAVEYKYDNGEETPVTLERTISFQINDGDFNSAVSTKTINFAPLVLSVVPSDGAEAVPASGNVAITFSEAMNPSAGAVSLTPSGGSATPLTGGSWSSANTIYTVAYSGLAYNTSYTIGVSGFRDTTGNSVSAYSKSFTTELEPLTPTVTPETLSIDKGSTAGVSVALGQGTAAATTAAIAIVDSTIATVDASLLSENGTITVSGLAAGTTDITVTFNDASHTQKTVSITVNPVSFDWPAESSLTASITGSNGTSGTVSVTSSGGTAAAEIGSAQGNALAGGGALEVAIPTVKDAVSYGVKLPASSLHGDEGGTLTIKTELGGITVSSNMLSSDTSDKTAEITIGQGNKENLSEDVKAAVGNRPLVQLTLSIDGTQTDWSNPAAPVTVSIPYTPTAEELANQGSIVVWYIDGSGNLVAIPNGHYDQATGNVTFLTTHFSQYAVGYNNIAFSDVPQSAWCSDAVSFIAARGITGGTSNTTFSPNAALKRGQFITLLMRAYGIDPDDNSSDNFSDAGSTYYTGYLAAAKRLGISNGVGDNEFAPEQAISRQQMFTMLYNTLKKINRLPEGDSGKTLSDFTDGGSISSYAMEAMDYLVKNGVVSGNNGCLLPSATTTRAQMAQVIYNLLET